MMLFKEQKFLSPLFDLFISGVCSVKCEKEREREGEVPKLVDDKALPMLCESRSEDRWSQRR